MAYIELHQALFDHRKTITAADLLDVPEVHLVGHLAALWTWCLDNAPDGLLPCSERVIARGARWTEDANRFVSALVDARFIDETLDGLMIHDWPDYGGKLIAKRRANAEKQARYRDNLTPKNDVTDTLPSRNALEKSREEKKRVEKSNTPPVIPLKGEPATKPKTIKTPIPEHLYESLPGETVAAMMAEQSMTAVEINFETAKMVDHFKAKGERRADWVATWRNWMRSDFRKPRAPTNGVESEMPAYWKPIPPEMRS